MSTTTLHELIEVPPYVGLELVPVACALCGADDGEPVAVGEDFEYRTSADSFLAVRCRRCGLLYLSPRPTARELPRIYPSTYHAFDFSPERFGFVYRVRRALETRRALAWCRGLPPAARVIDIGCGDGFHLKLLRAVNPDGWTLEGIDSSMRAVAAARAHDLTVHLGTIETVDLPEAEYDLALLIATIEHVADPVGVLAAVHRLLRPGGRAILVTDNANAPDFRLFGGRHWGGYHFPRHWNLFTRETLAALANRAGLEVVSIETTMSPVNWVYSLRNALDDWGAPRWIVNRFSLRSPVSLAAFTVVDTLCQLLGAGALLRASLRRPLPYADASYPPLSVAI
jgi:SAM-dependent methyltransferase